MVAMPSALPALADVTDRLLRWGWLGAGLAFALTGMALLVIVNARALDRNADEAPLILRPPLDPFARSFVFVFALAPPLLRDALDTLTGAPDTLFTVPSYLGGAKASDLVALARTVRDGVRDAFGVTLVPEPVLLGVSLD